MNWWDSFLIWLRSKFAKPAPDPTPTPEPVPEPVPTPTPDPEPTPEPATDHGGQTRTFWVHWNSVVKKGSTGASAVLDRAAKRDYALLNAWDSWMIPELKRRNPNIKCFVYKDLSSTRSYDNSSVELQPCGVRYADANDSWFLKDANGKRIEYSGYPGHWLMDIGNPAYQDEWIENVLASIEDLGFDGVFMDNALWTRNAYGATPAKYSSDAEFQAAYRSFLNVAHLDFGLAGKLMIANLSNARLVNGRWETYMEYLDGAWDEWWLVISDTDLLSEYDAGWSRVVGEIEKNEANRKITLVQPHFSVSAREPFLYAWASYLMVNGSRAAITEINRTDDYGLPTSWHPEYDWDLGEPLEDRQQVSPNVWRRRFANGVVVVNCNRTSIEHIRVDLGGTYENGVVALSLPGTSGAVLRK